MFLAAAVVLVQILPPALSDRYGERLITACTQGLREGACVLSSEAMGNQPSAVVAEVRWEDETFRVAEIRLGRLNLGEREWSSGKVAFDEGDAMDDRWTTAGFTIATLAGDLETRAERSATRPEAPAPITRPSAPVVAERSPAPSRQTPGVPLRLAAGYSVSQAMVSQPLRSGPWLAASYAPWEIPVKARVRAAVVWVNDSTASVRWTTMGAGLEARLPASRMLPGLLVAADVGPSLVTASANRQRTRVSASFNAFFGGDVSLVGPLSLVAGADLTAGPSTALLLDSGPMNDRRFKFGGIVGVVANL